jgi:hypothetical protein
MDRIQERNPIFTGNKDPMIEIEYERLLEVGALAFEQTEDLEGLLAEAESRGQGYEPDEDGEWEYDDAMEEDVEELDEELDENMHDYVNEVGLMMSLALERLALPQLKTIDNATLIRLSEVPDLTLLDVSEETVQPEESVVHDFSALRQAAKEELHARSSTAGRK